MHLSPINLKEVNNMHNENIEQLKLNVRSVRRSFIEKIIWLFIQLAVLLFTVISSTIIKVEWWLLLLVFLHGMCCGMMLLWAVHIGKSYKVLTSQYKNELKACTEYNN